MKNLHKFKRTTSNTQLLKLITATAIAGSLLSPAINAQNNEARQSTAARLIEEIQVTGRKKSNAEAIQDVPIAISAFSGEQLDSKFVYDLEGLSFSMPNVSLDDIGTTNGVANFSVRGLGINSSIPSIDPTVGVFVDGVYLGITSGVIYDFFDLDGIEVLRGPQGTLFGRNVTGGAVLIKTARPTDQFEFKTKLSVEQGSEGIANKVAAFTASGPLIDDVLKAKIAVYKRDNDGWHKNLATGDQFGEEDVTLIRTALSWTPNDESELWVSYENGEMETQGPAAQNRGFYDKDSFDFSIGTEGFGDSEWQNFVVEYNIDVGFGNGTITNVLGWRDFSTEGQSDIDGQPAILFDARFKTFQDQLSNELRYAGNFGDLDITAGLYWFKQDLQFLEHRDIPGPGISAAMGGEQEQQTLALFSQLDYTVAEDHILTLGLRYSKEEKDAKVATFNPPAPRCNIDLEACTYNFIDDNSWSYGTYKLGYQWLASEDVQLYSSLSTAVRAGGYNLRSTNPLVPPGPFDEETSLNFEVGMKADFIDKRLRTNIAVFQNRIDDLQREINVPSAVGVTQTILNAADATITGIELEIQALLTDNLLLTASIGTLNGTYRTVREDLNRDGNIDQADKDLKIPRLAPVSMSTGIIYDIFLGDFGTLTTSLNYSYRDESFYTDSNNGRINNANMLDLSFALTTLEERLRISLYGKNLKNEVVNGGDTILPFGPGQTFSPLNEGRTVGLEFNYQF